MMQNDFLEPEFKDVYDTWKAAPSPETNTKLIGALEPVIQKGMQSYGVNDPVGYSRARLMTLDAVRKYDPRRASLQSHILTNLQGLRRATTNQQNFVRIPERLAIESQRLHEAQQQLQDDLNRLPSDNELADHMGVPLKRLAQIRRARSGYAGSQVQSEDTQEDPSSRVPGQSRAAELWTQIVYDDLGPIDQKIMEHTLGLNGQDRLSNQEIAAKLGRSPGAITQRKLKIQQLLDRETELSPFLGD